MPALKQILEFHISSFSDMKRFSGKMERLLQSDISLDETPRRSCWAHDVDGKAICHGKSMSTKLLLSVPIVLVCDLEDALIKKGNGKWDYPLSLNLLCIETQEWVYDLVGRVFYNGSHFITRFAGYFDGYGSEVIFAYDGMQNGGQCIFLPSSTCATHFAGPDNQLVGITSGYQNVSVVYRLRGGYESQKAFLQHQISEINNRFAVDFGPDHLDEVPIGTIDNSRYHLFPDGVVGGIWMPTVGTLQLKMASGVEAELLELAEAEPRKKRKRSTPEFSDNESLSTSHKQTKTATNPPADSKKRKRTESDGFSSDIDIDCRCGEKGYGHLDDREVSQRALMCDHCRCWSHLACTRGISHPDIQIFLCHKCAPTQSDKVAKRPALCRSDRM